MNVEIRMKNYKIYSYIINTDPRASEDVSVLIRNDKPISKINLNIQDNRRQSKLTQNNKYLLIICPEIWSD